MKTAAWACVPLLLLVACGSSWGPTQLVDGYQIMVMNSEEVYIAKSDNELMLGPKIKSVGITPRFVVVDCGREEIVINGFANTVGFNLIDRQTGDVKKGMSATQVEEALGLHQLPMPEMRPVSSYLP